jgi:hypothetical protein
MTLGRSLSVSELPNILLSSIRCQDGLRAFRYTQNELYIIISGVSGRVLAAVAHIIASAVFVDATSPTESV